MICAKCGSKNRRGTKFCVDCGSALTGGEKGNPKKKIKQSPVVKKAPVSIKNGSLIALLAANVVLIAVAVVFIIMMTSTASAQGLWYGQGKDEVLALADDGRAVLYTRDSQFNGSYVYKKDNGSLNISGTEFVIHVEGDMMIIDQTLIYHRILDSDFDVMAFLKANDVVNTGDTVTTPAPTATPMPTATPVPTQNEDALLAQEITLNTWYGYYKYANDGLETYKTESDRYEFYSDGTFAYQYAGGGEILRGPWEINNGRLTAEYENSELGTVSWDIEIMYEDEYILLFFYDTRPGYEGGYWIYTDVPVEEIE